MESSDNEQKDTDYNSNKNQNLNELTRLTNFTLEQIENFHKYFRKCKIKVNKPNSEDANNNQIDVLNKEEFKNSLGVLSTKSCDYISNRLFEVVSGEGSNFLSFREYILYLDLVNYGSKEDKLKHCFKFFDIGNKGFITNKDFTTIMYNLCLFLSSLTISQILINENELSLFYDHYIAKAKIKQLDFTHFKELLANFPSFLDFYDIFNNNIYYEMNFFVKKEEMEKLIEIKNRIFDLKNRINLSQAKCASVSLVTEEYIDDIIEERKDLGNISSISLETKNNGIENNNIENNFINDLFSSHESELEMKNNINMNNLRANGALSTKIKNDKKLLLSSTKDNYGIIGQFTKIMKNLENFKSRKNEEIEDTSFDLSESSFDNDDNSFISLCKRQSSKKKKVFFRSDAKMENKNNSIYKKSMSKISSKNIADALEKKKNKFKFLKPFTEIRDEKLSKQLKKNGYNLDNILILTNKNDFQTFIDELISSLVNIINNILPENMKSQKRQGIRLGENFEFDLGKIKSVKAFQDREAQKNIIHFGNPNLKLVINIMIGIKSAVTKIGDAPGKEVGLKIPYLFPVDNLGVYEEMNRFMYEQNNYDGVIKCKFYDYAPKIFYNLRSLYGILNDDYLKSLGPENFLCNLIITKNKSLKEICSSGKSGSFFYYSYDSKYLMKTIPESEFLKFKEMLQDYYLYIYEHPQTLLQRFFGLYMCIFNDTKMYFVVMNNVFDTSLQIHYKYDLKGSTYKRVSRKCKEVNYDKYDFDIAMKDQDFIERKETIDISMYNRRCLCTEAHNDSKFLSDHNINDYSFLIGVYDQKFTNKEQLPQEEMMVLTGKNVVERKKSLGGTNATRKPFYEQYFGGIQSEDKTKVYFFGIIDIFTNYGATKKVEYIVKSVSQGNGISCKPPNIYSQRFIKFIDKILDVENETNNNNININNNNNNNNINNININKNFDSSMDDDSEDN